MITKEALQAASQEQLDELLALLTTEFEHRGLDITTGEPLPSHDKAAIEEPAEVAVAAAPPEGEPPVVA